MRKTWPRRKRMVFPGFHTFITYLQVRFVCWGKKGMGPGFPILQQYSWWRCTFEEQNLKKNDQFSKYLKSDPAFLLKVCLQFNGKCGVVAIWGRCNRLRLYESKCKMRLCLCHKWGKTLPNPRSPFTISELIRPWHENIKFACPLILRP